MTSQILPIEIDRLLQAPRILRRFPFPANIDGLQNNSEPNL
jgi:hypothetical protein